MLTGGLVQVVRHAISLRLGCPRRRAWHEERSPVWRTARVMLLVVTLGASPALAASFQCGTAPNGSPYCSYSGPVHYSYVNENGSVLLFWDPSITLAEVEAAALAAGWTGLSLFDAAAVQILPDPQEPTDPDNLGFAELVYSTLLVAQTSGLEVSIQMRPPVYAGRLRIDRIWMKGP